MNESSFIPSAILITPKLKTERNYIMKPSAIIQTESNSYRFKIKYSTICDLRELGVDLMSKEGNEQLKKDPNQFRSVFWKGLEAGEMKKFKKEEAYDIFDEVMEEIGPEEFASIIPKALAIKTNGNEAKNK